MITIVGSGLCGATAARILTDAGRKVTVLDERYHEGGNVYTPIIGGVPIHLYGPHLFHCNDDRIWNFVNRFCNFVPYLYRPRAYSKDRFYSFPINLLTFHQIDPRIKTPADAERWIDEERKLYQYSTLSHLEAQWLAKMGPNLYEMFFKHYTRKQWGQPAINLLPSISGRVPISTSFGEDYFPNDKYKALPVNGYSELISGLLKGIEIHLEWKWQKGARGEKVIYTGMLDELFDFSLGHLPYRSLDFKHTSLSAADSQGCAVINWCDQDTTYTRTIEHWRFLNKAHDDGTILFTTEYPCDYISGVSVPYYPLPTHGANELARNYKELAASYDNILLGGRLGSYKYLDMHQAIGNGMKLAEEAMSKWPK